MLRLYRMGTDSELVLTYHGTLVPAANFLREHNFPENLSTNWIGVDGHTSTLELRPRPFHNIMGVMGDLAAALAIIHTKLPAGYTALASPRPYPDSPLGSHIHLSGYTTDRICGVLSCGKSDCLSDIRHTLAKRLTAILTPLEIWLQPREERLARYASYGSQSDCREQPLEKVPQKLGPWKKFYVEHRHPSTFLAHPYKALMYLGCAKLGIINFNHLPSPDGYPEITGAVPEGKRQAKLWFGTLKIVTSDLKRVFYPVWKKLYSDQQLAIHIRETVEVDFRAWKEWEIK